MMPPSVHDLITDDILAVAYEWLVQRRRNYPDSADIWSFRRHWPSERRRLGDELLAGTYQFSLLTRVTLATGNDIDLWAARDALVLKCLTLVLSQHLPRSPQCFHLKTEGEQKKGVKAARDSIQTAIADHRFVLRTDVKSYYASISHQRLLADLTLQIQDKRLLNLLAQYLSRSAERGGLFWSYKRGIPLACSLSPLLGGFFLYGLDTAMTHSNVFYLQYMDDILVLTPTRNALRRAVRVVNRHFDDLDLEKHPDKTFIGRIERGFNFLGVHYPH